MPENLYPQLPTAPPISQESFNIEMVRKYYQDIANLKEQYTGKQRKYKNAYIRLLHASAGASSVALVSGVSTIGTSVYGAPNGSKIVFWKGRYFFRDRDILVEREILLQRSRYFLRKVRYLFRNRDTSMEIEDTSLEIEMLLVGILSLVAGYFLLSRDTSRLSREASVVLSFFCSLHHCSLCRIMLNENEATLLILIKNCVRSCNTFPAILPVNQLS